MSPEQLFIFHELTAERSRQDRKWGTKDLCSLPKWLAIAMEELGEAAEAQDVSAFRDEMVQLAAVAVKTIEYIDRGGIPPVEEEIFLTLRDVVKNVGMLARGILDSRKGTTTGKATLRQVYDLAVEADTAIAGLRVRVTDEWTES